MLRSFFVSSLLCFTFACSSRIDPVVQVEDLPQNYNPGSQLTMLQDDLNEARTRQVDVLSPSSFKQSLASYEKAEELRSKQGSLERIAGEIRTSRESLKKAEFNASIARKNVPDLIQVRDRLLLEQGDQLSSFDKYESEFEDIMEMVEDEKLERARKSAVELRKKMDNLVTEAIKAQALGSSKREFKSISSEDREMLPKTAEQVQQLIQETEAFIDKNRENDAVIVQKSRHLNQQVERLKVLIEEAKKQKDMPLESKVLRTEGLIKMASGGITNYSLGQSVEKRAELTGQQAARLHRQLAYAENDLRMAYDQLGKKSKNLQDLRSEAAQKEQRLSSIKRENQKIARIREVLGAKNAQVYQKDNQILVHLIGLEFEEGSYRIPSSRYDLLGDLGQVLGSNFSNTEIVIEGHTDSSGSKNLNQKLARRRAMAVRDFIAANQKDIKGNLKVAQANYESPIATNKTKQGRQQNRRVDLIISDVK